MSQINTNGALPPFTMVSCEAEKVVKNNTVISTGTKQQRIIFDELKDQSRFYIACKKKVFFLLKFLYIKVPCTTDKKTQFVYLNINSLSKRFDVSRYVIKKAHAEGNLSGLISNRSKHIILQKQQNDQKKAELEKKNKLCATYGETKGRKIHDNLKASLDDVCKFPYQSLSSEVKKDEKIENSYLETEKKRLLELAKNKIHLTFFEEEKIKSYVKQLKPNILQNRDFALLLVKHFGFALEWLSEDFKKDKEIVLAAACSTRFDICDHKKHPFFWAHSDLKKDKDYILDVFNKLYERYNKFDDHVLASYDFIKEIWETLDEDLKKDREFNLNFIKNSLQINSKDFNLEEHMLSILDANFKKDKNFILEVFKLDVIKKSRNGYLSDLLKFMDKELLKDSEIILQALQIEKDQQGDKQSYHLPWLELLNSGQNENREFIRKFIEIMPFEALKFACDDLKKDPELILAAIKKDKRIATCVNAGAFKDSEFLKELHVSPVPYPLSISFTCPEDINRALQIEEVSQVVDDKIVRYEHININTDITKLSLAAKALQLAYAYNNDYPCRKNISIVISKFQDLVKDSVSSDFLGICMDALESHSMAIKFVESGNLKLAFQRLNRCANEAGKMREISQEMVDEVLNLCTLVQSALSEVEADKNLTLAFKSLKITLKSLESIKTKFNNTTIFWSQVKGQWEDLTKEEKCNLCMSAGIKEPFINEIKNSGLNWLVLGKIILACDTTWNLINKEVDAIMCNLPTRKDTPLLIKKLTSSYSRDE